MFKMSFSLLYYKKNCKKLPIVLLVLIMLALFYIVSKLKPINERLFANLNIEIPINFVPVRITQRELLPTTGKLKIPKRIHQIWKSSKIPAEFASWVKTWSDHHPDWEYWLWTDESARKLISEKHVSLLSTFLEYEHPFKRANALRYIVLYEYGGIYADLDMEVLSSLEPLALKYSCFIGQEPYEHPILDSNFHGLVNNAIMGCRPHHPFFKTLIENLAIFSIMRDMSDSTGPHFVIFIYRKLYMYNNYEQLDEKNRVFLAPSEYFYPMIDHSKISNFIAKCNNFKKLSKLQKNACRNLKFKNLFQNIFNSKLIAFTNYHWSQTYFHDIISSIPIHKVVPNVIFYH